IRTESPEFPRIGVDRYGGFSFAMISGSGRSGHVAALSPEGPGESGAAMAKNKSDREEPRSRPSTPDSSSQPRRKREGRYRWHAATRCLVSLLVVLHLAAVFAAPWDLSTQPALPPGYLAALDEQGREPPLPEPNSPVWQQPVVPRLLRTWAFRHY